MKTLKVMSIVGICWAGLCLVCIVAWNNSVDYESAVGWGLFAVIYLMAFSIVALVKANKK